MPLPFTSYQVQAGDSGRSISALVRYLKPNGEIGSCTTAAVNIASTASLWASILATQVQIASDEFGNPNPGVSFNRVAAAADSSSYQALFILLQGETTYRLYVIKRSRFGQILWGRCIFTPFQLQFGLGELLQPVVDDDDNVYVGLTGYNGGDGRYQFRLAKISPDGSMLWARLYTGHISWVYSGYDIYNAFATGLAVVAGRPVVFLQHDGVYNTVAAFAILSPMDGALVWNRQLPVNSIYPPVGSSSLSRAVGLLQLANGNVVAVINGLSSFPEISGLCSLIEWNLTSNQFVSRNDFKSSATGFLVTDDQKILLSTEAGLFRLASDYSVEAGQALPYALKSRSASGALYGLGGTTDGSRMARINPTTLQPETTATLTVLAGPGPNPGFRRFSATAPEGGILLQAAQHFTGSSGSGAYAHTISGIGLSAPFTSLTDLSMGDGGRKASGQIITAGSVGSASLTTLSPPAWDGSLDAGSFSFTDAAWSFTLQNGIDPLVFELYQTAN